MHAPSPPPPDVAASVRARIWDAGYRPVAVYNFDADVPDPQKSKAPRGADWPARARQNPPEAAVAAVESVARNTGILCDGLRAIDIDIDSPTLAHSVRAKALDRFGETLIRTRSGSPRCLLVYRAASGEPPKRVVAGKLGKVEVLGRGQQFVAYGVHWPSEKELVWVGGDPTDTAFDQLPAVTEDEISAFLDDAAESLGAAKEKRHANGNGAAHTSARGLRAETLQVVAALLAISNSEPPNWEFWNKIGMATWLATNGSPAGLLAFHAWSEQNPAYDPAATAERWQHYFSSPPTHIGAGTLFYLAGQTRAQTEEPPPHPGENQTGGHTDDNAGPEHPQATSESSSIPWPEALGMAAYHGLAGDFVSKLLPHTESDPAALLFQFLAAAGSIIGGQPHYRVEGDRHAGNINVIVCGDSSKARKGTSLGRIREFFGQVDPEWVRNRVATGLSSGEGLINLVRDPVTKIDEESGEPRVVDTGEPDKRLLVIASEYAGVFAVMARAGNTLSPVLRDAWDHHNLQTITKTSPLRAADPHISIIAHITIAELARCLDSTAAANGFANRHLFVCARRARLLPHGGGTVDWTDEVVRMRDAIAKAKMPTEVRFDAEAYDYWSAIYERLAEPTPGLCGAIVARAEAQVIRLALIYALLDQDNAIRMPHLRAAEACWMYAAASARRIFGDALGDPIADTILEALRRNSDGLTRTDMSNLFGRNESAAKIQGALGQLLKAGLARPEKRAAGGSGGKPAEVWHATRR